MNKPSKRNLNDESADVAERKKRAELVKRRPGLRLNGRPLCSAGCRNIKNGTRQSKKSAKNWRIRIGKPNADKKCR